jgi:hypothetical protein
MTDADYDAKFAPPADAWPQKGGSGSGTNVGYTVEARLAYMVPQTVVGMVLDTRWQRINFPQGVPGVREKTGSPYDVATYWLHTWAAAQALRWWFHSEADLHGPGSYCLETRIVEHRVNYTYSVEAVGAHAQIGGNVHRSNFGPDKAVEPVPQDEPTRAKERSPA